MSSTIYIVSDGTGETASMMVKAAVVQYRDKPIQIVKSRNVRTNEQLESLVDEVSSKGGLLVHTLASESMRKHMADLAAQKGLKHIDLLGPLLSGMSHYLGDTKATGQAGLLRAVDETYFKRIEAIEFTVKHDDGKSLAGLKDADIILVGISRTSKTPLSIFLSHKGWKVANVPLVLNQPLPEELQQADQRKIVGLIIDADSLQRIRKKRLEKFGQDPGSEYASVSYIMKEIDYALELYKKNKRWPVFNVTDRALEESASEIVRFVSSRLGLPSSL
jgi:[pyruvate, water dikinase]-phosphate phosphotransferase / [pyruvate, water dikinase] kinase